MLYWYQAGRGGLPRCGSWSLGILVDRLACFQWAEAANEVKAHRFRAGKEPSRSSLAHPLGFLVTTDLANMLY
jgi:hypothetical protein